MMTSLIVSFIHEGIYFFVQWKKELIRSESLEKENLLSQFETLKNQVNPHFLFNSFNTLITIIEEDREQAVEYVQKLSDFFRTILQLREKSVISLREELELIRNYYFIQKKRYGQNLNLQINVNESSMGSSVAPLTLQMLLENAIKHNIISTDKPLLIEISLEDPNYILVRNNLQKRHEPENGSGLGLENIKNRYRFLSEKEVEIIVTPKNFTVAIPVLHIVEE
jgi:LytS/YehU family sensor histidine kinase